MRHNKFLFGFAGIFDISSKLLKRYDAVLGFENKDFDVFLHHDTPKTTEGSSAISLGKLYLRGVYRHNKQTFAGEVAKLDKKVDVSILGSHKVDDKLSVKAKAVLNLNDNNPEDYNLYLSGKKEFSDKLSVTAGAKIGLRGDKSSVK